MRNKDDGIERGVCTVLELSFEDLLNAQQVMILNKVFIQCKILSGATILCTCMPTQISPHKYIDYTQLTLQPTYTDGKRDLRWRKTAVWSGKKGQVYCFRKSPEVRFEEVQRGCLLERMVKIIPCKGARTNWKVWYEESGG